MDRGPPPSFNTDPVEAGTDVVSTVETEPVYNYKGWIDSKPSGMQCSKHGAYCFLCDNIVLDDGAGAAEGGGEEDEANSIREDVVAINNYITIMVEQDKSAQHIVEGVYNYYNKRVREKIVDYVHPVTGEIVPTPRWTQETIVNHIMFSNNPTWSRMFGSACTMMLRGLVLKANHATIDTESGRIIPDAAESLCKFIERHDKHVKEQLLIAELIEKSRTRRGVGHIGKSSR